jgi:multiple sugar transport system ATP-binding protein
MRVSTRTEISKLHVKLATTMIYVTHDQVEAMTMGDRICVMKDGDIMQVAEPLELYNRPANMFVAGFIGSPPMNFIHGWLKQSGSQLEFVEKNASGGKISILLDDALSQRAAAYAEKPVVFGIRPEDVNDASVNGTADAARTIAVKVEVSEPMGHETNLYLDTGAHSFIARVRSTDMFEANQMLKVRFNLANAHVFDPETERVIR